MRLGIVPVPEGRDHFPTQSVQQNIQDGAVAAGERWTRPKKVWLAPTCPHLEDLAGRRTGALSSGEQQVVKDVKNAVAAGVVDLLVDQNVRLHQGVASRVY